MKASRAAMSVKRGIPAKKGRIKGRKYGDNRVHREIEKYQYRTGHDG